MKLVQVLHDSSPWFYFKLIDEKLFISDVGSQTLGISS